MTWIVDASIAVKWYMRDEDSRTAALSLLEGDVPLEAPDLVVVEVANVAWKKVQRGEIPAVEARLIAIAVPRYLTALHASTTLIDRALEIALALGHPIYDCLYLSCAELVGGTLVTADQRLGRAVEGTPFDGLVRHIDRIGPLDPRPETAP